MRALCIVLLLLCAAPCYAGIYYVNASTGSNQDTSTGWGLSADSPWATPSYAATKLKGTRSDINAHDTVYIYGYADSSPYNDYVDGLGATDTLFVDWIGVSVNGCSPTVWGPTNATRWEFGGYGSGVQNTYFSLQNILFFGISANGSAHIQQYKDIYVNGCIFKSNANGIGALYLPITQTGTSTVVVRNCMFSSNSSAYGAIAAYTSEATNGAFMSIYLDQVTMRNDSYAFSVSNFDNVANAISFSCTNSIITGCKLMSYEAVTANFPASVRMTNCDTFNLTRTATSVFGSGTLTLTQSYTGCTTADPLFANANPRTDTYGYLQATSTLHTFGTNGYGIGVLWGTNNPPPVPVALRARRVSPLSARYYWLLRGRF